MSKISLNRLKIIKGKNKLSIYKFGEKRHAEHFFCSNCGIYTHHRSYTNPENYEFNVACLDNVRQNPGHLYSSISFNISITKISEIKKILADEDYIISSYGSDIAELIRNILIGDYGNHMNLLKKFSARLFLKEVFSNENQPNIKLTNLTTIFQ